jgi:hypothetical protein
MKIIWQFFREIKKNIVMMTGKWLKKIQNQQSSKEGK